LLRVSQRGLQCVGGVDRVDPGMKREPISRVGRPSRARTAAAAAENSPLGGGIEMNASKDGASLSRWKYEAYSVVTVISASISGCTSAGHGYAVIASTKVISAAENWA
jgi:hypothetical protein